MCVEMSALHTCKCMSVLLMYLGQWQFARQVHPFFSQELLLIVIQCKFLQGTLWELLRL